MYIKLKHCYLYNEAHKNQNKENKQDIQLNKLRTSKNKILVPNNTNELGYDGNLKTKTKFQDKQQDSEIKQQDSEIKTNK